MKTAIKKPPAPVPDPVQTEALFAIARALERIASGDNTFAPIPFDISIKIKRVA